MTNYPISGHVAPGFEPVRDQFEAHFENDEELGAGFAVWLGDELVIDLNGGFADRQKQTPWTGTTLIPVYSTTKGISAFVLALAIDESGGDVTYETRISNIWPEFAAAGKGDVTIAEAMSHEAGLPGFVEPIDPELWLDPPALAAELAATAPMWPPGDGSGYHPLTWGYIAGELVQRIAGQSLGTILRERVTEPNGIDFWIGLPESQHSRVGQVKRPTAMPELGELNVYNRTAFLTKWAAAKRGGAIWKEIEIPSANGHGTAVSTARLYGVYAGTLDIGLSSETYADLTRLRCSGQDRVLPYEIDFAAGVMRNTQGVYGPNPNSFGHSGWGGSLAMGDPDRGLSAAYVMNRQSNILQGDPRAVRLIQSVYGCL